VSIHDRIKSFPTFLNSLKCGCKQTIIARVVSLDVYLKCLFPDCLYFPNDCKWP
jgi:hypothetical protein